MTATILKEKRMVRRFEEAGALSPDSARSLEQIGISSGRILRRLRDRLVVRHLDGDLFYVDEEVWAALGKKRRRHASVAAIAAAVLILGILLFTKTAHAGFTPGGVRSAGSGPQHAARG